MKAVIQDLLSGAETPIPGGSYAVYGDAHSKLRIIIRKQGNEEIVEINGDSSLEVMPRAANSVYTRVEK